jgi:hypothetical protein
VYKNLVYRKDVWKCKGKIGSAKSHNNWSARQGKILHIFTNPQFESTSPTMLELGHWSDVGWVSISEERQLYSSYEKMMF